MGTSRYNTKSDKNILVGMNTTDSSTFITSPATNLSHRFFRKEKLPPPNALNEEEQGTALGIELRLKRNRNKTLPRKALMKNLTDKVKKDFLNEHSAMISSRSFGLSSNSRSYIKV